MTEAERIQDLKDRWNSLNDVNATFDDLMDEPNKDSYFRDKILDEPNKVLAEQRLNALEIKDSQLKIQSDLVEYLKQRESEYPSIEKLVVALWEHAIENKPASAIQLEAERQTIKTKYPKP